MHNISDRRLFTRDVQVELKNLCVTDSTDTAKAKVLPATITLTNFNLS